MISALEGGGLGGPPKNRRLREFYGINHLPNVHRECGLKIENGLQMCMPSWLLVVWEKFSMEREKGSG